MYWHFVDLQVYDRVPGKVMYWSLRKRRVPEKIRLVKMLYEGAKTTVQTRYGETESFPVEVGPHQGSALSPYLFLIVLDTITMDVRDNEDLWELLFADDLVIIADTEEELQERYLLWKGNLERKGMKVSTQKTEVTVSNGEGYEEINVTSEDGIRLKQTREFKYLGSIMAGGGGTEKAVRQSKTDRDIYTEWDSCILFHQHWYENPVRKHHKSHKVPRETGYVYQDDRSWQISFHTPDTRSVLLVVSM